MSFPRYPKYKDSGVEWLGDVPEHWGITKLKWQIERNDGGVWGADPEGVGNTIVLRSTEQTVDGHWRIEDPAERKLTDSEVDSALLIEGDLLMTKSSGSSLHIGKTTLVTKEVAAIGCCYSNFMQRIRTRKSFVPELAWYVMNSDLARLQLDLLSNSTTGLANLNATVIGQILVPTAPIDEQSLITAFLARETAKIDELVAEQRRLMELLKEKRQAVISHAVTKGLNPDAPMKPSGIEWLGDVPAHWDCASLIRIASRVVVGIAEAATHAYADEGVAILRSTNIRAGKIIGDILYVDPAFANERGSKRINAGDLVTVRTGNAGVTVVVPPELDGCQCFTMLITTLNDDSRGDYYCYWMNSVSAQCYFSLEGWGTAQVNISVPILKELPVPLPPTSEQKAIATYLDREIAKLDALTTETQHAIDLLQERRIALISAAVTGQIDVRSLAKSEAA